MEVTAESPLIRQGLYRLYAGLLLYPEPERLQALRVGAGWLAEVLSDVSDTEIHSDTAERARAVAAWVASPDGKGRELQTEWVRLFGSSRDGYCYPYEGAYRGAESAGPLVAKLQKEYARGGLALTTRELPDHVAVELEYASFLCGLEHETLRSGEAARCRRIQEVRHRFLDQHLCKWLPTLAERLVAADGGPFAKICEAARDLSRSDLMLLEATLGVRETSAAVGTHAPQPSSVPPPVAAHTEAATFTQELRPSKGLNS